MHFAIAGAGVAGSYLGNMLQQRGHDVEIFEASKKERHWPVCAWGASKHMLQKFSDQAGLDFADYIFHVGHRLRMELPNDHEEYLDLNGLVTYDKHKWENDLLRNLKVTYGVKVSREAFRFDKYDYVIDCTGLVVMPGGIDVHSHIAGLALNHARLLYPSANLPLPSANRRCRAPRR